MAIQTAVLSLLYLLLALSLPVHADPFRSMRKGGRHHPIQRTADPPRTHPPSGIIYPTGTAPPTSSIVHPSFSVIAHNISSIIHRPIPIGSYSYHASIFRRPTAVITTYTIITPSPGGQGIPITSQSQLITSYVPQMTLCSDILQPPRGWNASTPLGTNKTANARSTGIAGRLPFSTNLSAWTPQASCTTKYSPTVTAVCATTLTGIASVVPITACDQQVTFLTQYGYVLSIPYVTGGASVSPAIQTVTTEYVAPWQALTSGVVPQSVTEKVCSSVAVGAQQCMDIFETWIVTTGTTVSSTTTTVDFTTTLRGPLAITVETFHATVTEVETEFRLSSVMVLESSVEAPVTLRLPLSSSASETFPLLTRTASPPSASPGYPPSPVPYASSSAAASTSVLFPGPVSMSKLGLPGYATSDDSVVTTTWTTVHITSTKTIAVTVTETLSSHSTYTPLEQYSFSQPTTPLRTLPGDEHTPGWTPPSPFVTLSPPPVPTPSS